MRRGPHPGFIEASVGRMTGPRPLMSLVREEAPVTLADRVVVVVVVSAAETEARRRTAEAKMARMVAGGCSWCWWTGRLVGERWANSDGDWNGGEKEGTGRHNGELADG